MLSSIRTPENDDYLVETRQSGWSAKTRFGGREAPDYYEILPSIHHDPKTITLCCVIDRDADRHLRDFVL
jgi:hypothetical protein